MDRTIRKTGIFPGVFLVLLISSPFLLLFPQDSLEIKYSIVGMNFYHDHDVIKLKVPSWLSSSELILQIKRSIMWPGEPPPRKTTYIYVFKETDQIGDVSRTGAVYIPEKGFIWSLSGWDPLEPPNTPPSEEDLRLYYYFIDRVIQNGSTLNNSRIRSQIAHEYSLTLAELDSICSWVKYWLMKKKAEQEKRRESYSDNTDREKQE
ncbi:MAG: hypothetical protein EH225_09490 [Calditrichaeota bacterium]|nr:hypothetical protein [Calditrichota bacterium]RQW01490.1 MAG: hypothetical protein EH225_09490 [Calditrichota bacterium]